MPAGPTGPRFARTAAALAAALCVAIGAGGCKKKEFAPGVYTLTGVFQVVRGPDGDEANRTELRIVGGATFTFDYDGEFLVVYSNYGVGYEKPCSGNYRGQYIVAQDDVVLNARTMSLPGFCRPSRKRNYRWEVGWGGTMTLERHWEDDQYIQYRLEPQK